MSELDRILSTWHEARRSANAQVNLHRSLGFPDTCLPSSNTVRHACLAALGIRAKLEADVAPYIEELSIKGSIQPGTRLSEVDAGRLAIIAACLPILHSVADLVESMRDRATEANAGPSGERAPLLGVPVNIRAALGQEIEVVIRCEAADRIFVCSDALGMPRAVIHPASQLTLTMTLVPGRLLVFAENAFGHHKIERDLMVGEVPDCAIPAHRERSCL